MSINTDLEQSNSVRLISSQIKERSSNVVLYSDSDFKSAHSIYCPIGFESVADYYVAPYMRKFADIIFGVAQNPSYGYSPEKNEIHIYFSEMDLYKGILALLANNTRALEGILKALEIDHTQIEDTILRYVRLLNRITFDNKYNLDNQDKLLLERMGAFFSGHPDFIELIFGNSVNYSVYHEVNHARLDDLYLNVAYIPRYNSSSARNAMQVSYIGFMDKFNEIETYLIENNNLTDSYITILQLTNHGMFKILLRDIYSYPDKIDALYTSYLGSLQELFNFMQFAILKKDLAKDELQKQLIRYFCAYIADVMFLFPDNAIVRRYLDLANSLDANQINLFLKELVALMNKESFDKFVDTHFRWLQKED